MYFPFALNIYEIPVNRFPTKTSLKEYVEETLQLGSVIKIQLYGIKRTCTSIIQKNQKNQKQK